VYLSPSKFSTASDATLQLGWRQTRSVRRELIWSSRELAPVQHANWLYLCRLYLLGVPCILESNQVLYEKISSRSPGLARKIDVLFSRMCSNHVLHLPSLKESIPNSLNSGRFHHHFRSFGVVSSTYLNVQVFAWNDGISFWWLRVPIKSLL
jgi:hypothetical protein